MKQSSFTSAFHSPPRSSLSPTGTSPKKPLVKTIKNHSSYIPPSNDLEISVRIDQILLNSSRKLGLGDKKQRAYPGVRERRRSSIFTTWLETIGALYPDQKQRKSRALSNIDPPLPVSPTGFSVHCCSLTGKNPLNPYKINQDRLLYVIHPPNVHLFLVCDGHGAFGHQVAEFMISHLPRTIFTPEIRWKTFKSTLISSVQTCVQTLHASDIETGMSGTTLNIVVIRDGILWCGNVGDSRAVLARMKRTRKWSAISLSRDHKPEDKEEAKRIQDRGGVIDSYRDEDGKAVGPARVWIKDQRTPGLAMSRSIGDNIAESVGVIPDPETIEMSLTRDDKFLILGSDGVFEFLKNEEAVKIAVPYWKKRDAKGAAERIVKEARSRWEAVRIYIERRRCG